MATQDVVVSLAVAGGKGTLAALTAWHDAGYYSAYVARVDRVDPESRQEHKHV